LPIWLLTPIPPCYFENYDPDSAAGLGKLGLKINNSASAHPCRMDPAALLSAFAGLLAA
jgi:hypothetical protein